MAKKLPGLRRHVVASPIDDQPPVDVSPEAAVVRSDAAPKPTPAPRQPLRRRAPVGPAPAANTHATPDAVRDEPTGDASPAVRAAPLPETQGSAPTPDEPALAAGDPAADTPPAHQPATQMPAAEVTSDVAVGEPAPGATDGSAAGDAGLAGGLVHTERADAARRIVERHGRYALVGGAMPLPVVDIAAVAAVQVRMLLGLARLYDIELSRHRASAVVMTLMGSVAPHALGMAAAGVASRLVPVVGWVAGMAGGGAAARAVTRVMGGLFVDHFERAGHADLDVASMGAHLRAEQAAGAGG